MRFDPILLSRAWQSVTAVEGTEKEMAALYRTVTIEFHDDGAFLIATDGSNLLHTWVPSQSSSIYDPAPSLDDDVYDVIVARDINHRALSLLIHVAKQAADENANPDDWAVDVDIHNTTGNALTLVGMESFTVTIAAAGESVTLKEWDGTPVRWRDICAAPVRHATPATCLPPAVLTRLVKAAKPHEHALISASFTGVNCPILVELVNSEPYISGVIMPARIDVSTTEQVA